MYSSLSRLEALEARTDFYRRLRVPPEYEGERRRKLAESWVKRALEHNRLVQRPAAVRALGTAVRVSPGLLLDAPGAVLSRRRGRAETTRSGER
jgi:hypothetical protein